MSSRGSPASSSTQKHFQYGRGLRTDSSPSLYRSFSSKPTTSSKSSSSINPTISSTSTESSSSSASTPGGSTILNVPYNETTRSTVPPRLQWNREAPAVYRPYDFQNFDVPFKALPAYHSQLGGLGVPARKPCHQSKPDPFHKRTHIDEIYHKRVTDASTFSITEKLPSDLCVKQKPSKISEITLKAVKSVVLADNVNSDEDESSDSDIEEDLCELSWEEFQERPKRNDVLKECKRSFFRARKELFKTRQYEEYLKEKNRQPEEVQSWEISSDSTVETVDADSVLRSATEEILAPIDECIATEIVHVEDKACVQEQSYMERVRKYMWNRYERKDMEEQKAQAERDKSPEPLDEEAILRNLPEQDYLNKRQHQIRKELSERLDELNRSIKLEPMNLPRTKVQFEEYNDKLMRARRELKDEAVLVDEHYKRAALKIDVPEKDLPLKKKYRAADYRSDEEKSAGDEDEALEPVVHTCMTRLEWSRWLGHYTKHEKLNLPKVKIPRLPKMVHTATEQSPIRMYIKGLHREDKRKKQERKQKKPSPSSSSVVMVKKNESKSIQWHLKEILYDKPEESRVPYFVRYKSRIRPFSELVKDRSRLMQAKNRRKRDLRKNHMTWINEVVEEICGRKYL
ncbi:uncharacterized protein LOC135697536 [Ochlerotatus camptorhynchus]|uniref:uncharacterized protein LOC135697536 n=1 Tax=Ochlerotatus camptorhynchus TaxID=644619 RepID=UPI0031D6A9FB